MYEPEPAELLMSPLPVGVEDDVEASLDVSLTDKEEGSVHTESVCLLSALVEMQLTPTLWFGVVYIGVHR